MNVVILISTSLNILHAFIYDGTAKIYLLVHFFSFFYVSLNHIIAVFFSPSSFSSCHPFLLPILLWIIYVIYIFSFCSYVAVATLVARYPPDNHKLCETPTPANTRLVKLSLARFLNLIHIHSPSDSISIISFSTYSVNYRLVSSHISQLSSMPFSQAR